MTSISTWKKRKNLLLTLVAISISLSTTQASVGQTNTINNTASGTASGTPITNSNTVRLTANSAALELIKTGDKAAAEPGDSIVYRLAITNKGTTAASNLIINDRLPLGIRLINKTLTGSINNNSIALTANSNSRSISISPVDNSIQLQPNQTLVIVYAGEITPDAIRGTGTNLAIAQAGNLTSNPSSHTIRIRPGILSDCGTLIGRVFIDKNNDGEQQNNEPGIGNAVIYIDDGTRIITDNNGLYSLSNVISGNRTATLDLTSLPGYALAPNKYIIEKNSHTRLAKLAPGSMVRINFGVTPAFGEQKR
ncbi:DUF11 domain-containing protein [Fortiea contorta]|uniref:DUF11 domain-containing protein n=1 Tax=Fortiea contorta TaxID=1892405 RepID=UPI000476A5A6|nr:DUF11 domain-containing protein [Fortiea contorta]